MYYISAKKVCQYLSRKKAKILKIIHKFFRQVNALINAKNETYVAF